jgi:hypothetical protein
MSQGYIGITTNPELRWKHHKSTNKNHKLYNAMAKYEDYEINILLCSTLDYCSDLERLLRPSRNIGLNHSQGGIPTVEERLKYEYSEDVRKKISEGLLRAYKENENFRNKQRLSRKGKTFSEESILKMKEASNRTNRNMWRNPKSDLNLWLKADYYFELFNKNNLTLKRFSELCSVNVDTIKTLYKHFKQGWNPNSDIEYLKFKEHYHAST